MSRRLALLCAGVAIAAASLWYCLAGDAPRRVAIEPSKSESAAVSPSAAPALAVTRLELVEPPGEMKQDEALDAVAPRVASAPDDAAKSPRPTVDRGVLVRVQTMHGKPITEEWTDGFLSQLSVTTIESANDAFLTDGAHGPRLFRGHGLAKRVDAPADAFARFDPFDAPRVVVRVVSNAGPVEGARLRWWLEDESDSKPQDSRIIVRGEIRFAGDGWISMRGHATDFARVVDVTTSTLDDGALAWTGPHGGVRLQAVWETQESGRRVERVSEAVILTLGGADIDVTLVEAARGSISE